MVLCVCVFLFYLLIIVYTTNIPAYISADFTLVCLDFWLMGFVKKRFLSRGNYSVYLHFSMLSQPFSAPWHYPYTDVHHACAVGISKGHQQHEHSCTTSKCLQGVVTTYTHCTDTCDRDQNLIHPSLVLDPLTAWSNSKHWLDLWLYYTIIRIHGHASLQSVIDLQYTACAIMAAEHTVSVMRIKFYGGLTKLHYSMMNERIECNW